MHSRRSTGGAPQHLEAEVSYDLAVWDGPTPPSDDAAAQEYERRLEQAEEDEVPAPIPAIEAYVDDLLTKFPDDAGASPWAGSPLLDDAAGDLLILTLTANSARGVCGQVAAQHGLVCFDPQTGTLLT